MCQEVGWRADQQRTSLKSKLIAKFEHKWKTLKPYLTNGFCQDKSTVAYRLKTDFTKMADLLTHLSLRVSVLLSHGDCNTYNAIKLDDETPKFSLSHCSRKVFTHSKTNIFLYIEHWGA